MTELRRRMLEELRLRNYAPLTRKVFLSGKNPSCSAPHILRMRVRLSADGDKRFRVRRSNADTLLLI